MVVIFGITHGIKIRLLFFSICCLGVYTVEPYPTGRGDINDLDIFLRGRYGRSEAEVGVASAEFMQLAARRGKGAIAITVEVTQRTAASGEPNLFRSMVSVPPFDGHSTKRTAA